MPSQTNEDGGKRVLSVKVFSGAMKKLSGDSKSSFAHLAHNAVPDPQKYVVQLRDLLIFEQNYQNTHYGQNVCSGEDPVGFLEDGEVNPSTTPILFLAHFPESPRILPSQNHGVSGHIISPQRRVVRCF